MYPTARKTMTAEEIEQVMSGKHPAIPRTTDPIDVSWLWAGHVAEQVPGDGTAECEHLVSLGLLAEADVAACECGCQDGRCYIYRIL